MYGHHYTKHKIYIKPAHSRLASRFTHQQSQSKHMAVTAGSSNGWLRSTVAHTYVVGLVQCRHSARQANCGQDASLSVQTYL